MGVGAAGQPTTLIALIPGAHTVEFSLAGFGTVLQEGIDLTTGVAVPINSESVPSLGRPLSCGARTATIPLVAPQTTEVQCGEYGGVFLEGVYTEVRYAARTWGRAGRDVIEAEVVRLAGGTPQDNQCFVITNLCQTRHAPACCRTRPASCRTTCAHRPSSRRM